MECAGKRGYFSLVDLSWINELPDVCLSHVLRQLPFLERFRLLNVSRHWRHLMSFRDVQTLDLGQFAWKDICVYQLEYRCENVNIIQRCITPQWLWFVMDLWARRIGPNLANLSLHCRGSRCLIDKTLLNQILQWWPRLEMFSISNCVLFEDATDLFPQLSTLHSFDCSGVTFVNANLVTITDYRRVKANVDSLLTNATDMEHFNAANMKFVPVVHSAAMTGLGLHAVTLSLTDIANIAESCPNLTKLSIGCCSALDFGPLQRLRRLKHLWMNSTRLNNNDFAAILRCCRELEDLRIDSCRQLTNFDPLKLTPLRDLSLFWVGPTSDFRDDHLIAMSQFGKLKSLVLMSSSITDTSVNIMSEMCPDLEQVNMRGSSLTSSCISMLILRCPKIFYLNLDKIRTIDNDDFMVDIGGFATALHTFSFRECSVISVGGFERLLAKRRFEMNSGAGKSFPELTIIYGDRTPLELPESLKEKLSNIGVQLLERVPLLALPGL